MGDRKWAMWLSIKDLEDILAWYDISYNEGIGPDNQFLLDRIDRTLRLAKRMESGYNTKVNALQVVLTEDS